MQNKYKKLRVAVGLSGGLDSSVTCLLLKEQGYDVVAVTVKMVNDEKFDTIIKNAEAVAKKIDIPHYVLDLHEKFQNDVIEYFINSYKNGETPNPCIICNRTIKWGALFDYAINELNCDYVSSGHYAKIVDCNGIKKLYPAKDTLKDQQYYLFELTQKHLQKILFPLSNYSKEDIRKIAIENDLPSKSAKESQDICFITKPMTTKKFITNQIDLKKGDFVYIKNNEKIGTHDGFAQYTIGQRKGIGIAWDEPLYVVKLDATKNIVYVGTKDDLYAKELQLKQVSIQTSTEKTEFEAFVKIRYNMQAQKAQIKLNKEKQTGTVIFETPITAITPGQAAVFYDTEDKHLIGGGWIV